MFNIFCYHIHSSETLFCHTTCSEFQVSQVENHVLPSPANIPSVLMKLSTAECAELCGSVEGKQVVSSGHLMVQHGKIMYKVIYSHSENTAFHWYVAALSSAPSKLIWPELIRIMSRPMLMVYWYDCVQYPPP